MVAITPPEKLYELFSKSTGVSTDSRTAAEGNIFFALSGENFDGHRFIDNALKAGCPYAVIDNEEFFLASGETLLVYDVLESLQLLAITHRDRFSIPVIAITGSNGKTTTKELMKEVLSARYCTFATRGNLNNHIGVPLSLLELENNHEIAIIEMGANHAGEIDTLCRIASPTHGLITNAGAAHLEGFGSFEGVLKAKSELFHYIDETGGTIILNNDRVNLREVASRLNCRLFPFGTGDEMPVRGRVIDSDGFLRMTVTVSPVPPSTVHVSTITIDTRLTGDYNFENVLAAACAGVIFNIEPEKIKAAIESYAPVNNRSQIFETGRNRLLLDAYNANPDSMRASILNFLSMPGAAKSVILGDMLELGEFADEEHKKVLELLRDEELKEVILVGEIFKRVSGDGPYHTFTSTDRMKRWLDDNPLSNRFILLKGSRGIGLERCISLL